MLTDEIMYQALVNKDASFEGVFFAAVKTTGIFCRSTCTARKPKPENVEFFATSKEAMQRGYRPCKVCTPLNFAGQMPGYAAKLIEEIGSNTSVKLRDYDLRKRGIEPAKIRRWFLKNHGITFHSFQRMYRLNTAFKKIQNGGSVTDTAFTSGYDSLSGFQDSFKSVFGVSPKNSKQQVVIDIARIETPLGTMFAGATGEGLCLLEYTDRRMLETELKQLAKLLNAVIVPGENKIFPELRRQLTEYFAGGRTEFTIPLCTPGSDFQKAVWKELQTIPGGTTRSYKQQAEALGKPEAIRAIAHANGMNRISIIIPCHRVIGSDGKLVGYGGGLWRKEKLLQLEKAVLR
ncbi:MAG: methylated-DNA--[protein]-cysteine S-methyltransferase [Ignavibacteriales bacterium]|nr:methylated-DNA--[protein]-cysteine S-methyltransferase [Ignavibacteriales bacterium]